MSFDLLGRKRYTSGIVKSGTTMETAHENGWRAHEEEQRRAWAGVPIDAASQHFEQRRCSIHRGGGGSRTGRNRTASNTPDSDHSRAVLRTGIDENTSKEGKEHALPDILTMMSRISDVNRELAEVGAMFAVFRAVRDDPARS